MSTSDARSSNNHRGSHAWLQSWAHLMVDRRSPGYCRVTFDHPPINTITATTVVELAELVDLIEDDSDLNVVVFDSLNPDFYLAHYDAEDDPGKTAALPTGPTGMHAWLDLLARLSRASVVSIASIRGRVRGAGSEFALACDLRFASRENSLLGQFEIATGVVPGGGAMARLPRLVGRGRALEILLGSDDLDARRAEQYGYINRAIADRELEAEVDSVLGDRDPEAGDADKLTWTRAVVSEAMRLYPPAWTIERDALADDEVAGTEVPAGSLVAIPPYLIHRHPDFWPDPAGFDPRRFLADGEAAPGNGQPAHRYAYIPFGGGRRACVGASFAELETVLVLATIARRYRLELTVRGIPAPSANVTLRPGRGLPMRLLRRS